MGYFVQWDGVLLILDASLTCQEELGKWNLGQLPVWATSGEEDIRVYIIPHDVIVAHSGDVEHVGAAIASNSEHNVRVHAPVKV